MKNRLTGKFYHKKTIFGLVLMVEYFKTVASFPGDDSPDKKLWRKAKEKDLAYLKMIAMRTDFKWKD